MRHDYIVWCGKLPGFGCRVRTTGYKSFIVMYRVGGRKATPRKVTIGVYGKLTVEREEAGKILAKAELGEDVALQRARVRAEMTVYALDLWRPIYISLTMSTYPYFQCSSPKRRAASLSFASSKPGAYLPAWKIFSPSSSRFRSPICVAVCAPSGAMWK